MWQQSYNKPLFVLFIGIWNANRSFNILNICSYSHSNSFTICLISFNSVMHCDSDLSFWNFFNRACLTSANVLVCYAGVIVWYFIYHNNAQFLNVVFNYAIFTSSSWIFFTVHIVSQMKKYLCGSSFPAPWKTYILKVGSTPTIVFYVILFSNKTSWFWLNILLPVL